MSTPHSNTLPLEALPYWQLFHPSITQSVLPMLPMPEWEWTTCQCMLQAYLWFIILLVREHIHFLPCSCPIGIIFLDPGAKVGFLHQREGVSREYVSYLKQSDSDALAKRSMNWVARRTPVFLGQPSIVHSNNGFDPTLLFFLEQWWDVLVSFDQSDERIFHLVD